MSGRKGSKFLNKNGTISEKGQNSSTKMVPFQKMVEIPRQKWYHFRKGSKILNKNGTVLESGENAKIKPTLVDFLIFISTQVWGVAPVARQCFASFTDIGARCWHDTGMVPTALLA